MDLTESKQKTELQLVDGIGLGKANAASIALGGTV